MAAAKKNYRVLVVFSQGDSTESIPVPNDYEVDPDMLLEEFLVVEAADGSTVVLRNSRIERLHLKPHE